MPTQPKTAPPAKGNGNGAEVRGVDTAEGVDSPSTSLTSLSSLRSLQSDILARAQFGLSSGLSTFDGKRDIHSSLGYKPKLSVDDYLKRYKRGGIAKRIVKFFPEAVWVKGAAVYEDPDPDVNTDFENAVDSLFDRLSVWSRLLRASILSGLGRYSILLIGAPDGNLESEMPRLAGPDSILYLQPLSEKRARIDEEDKSAKSERFGLPLTYQVQFGAKSNTNRKVHWTRVIHIARGLLEDDIYGEPELEDVWNNLDDLEKIVGGGAEAAWKRMDPGLHLELDPEYEMDPASLEGLRDKVDEYVHGLRRVIETQGIKINQLSASVNAFGANAETILTLIAGTKGIPKRVLLGSERGELASSQDRNNINDRITEYSALFATPILRSFLDRLIEYGGLPQPKTPYTIEWTEEEELTEDEKASVASKLAQANKAQKESEGKIIISSDEIRDSLFSMEPVEVEEIEEEDLEEVDEEGEEGEEVSKEEGEEENKDRSLLLRYQAESFDLADSPADEPEWRSIHRAADSHINPLARVFLGYWSDAAEEIDTDNFERVLDHRDSERAEQIISESFKLATNRLMEVLPLRIHTVLVDGGLAGLRSARARGSWFRAASSGDKQEKKGDMRGNRFSASFDSSNPRAINWAQLRSSNLVTEINPDTLLALRDLVGRGLRDGISPNKLRQFIRQSVGLRSDQLNAVFNLRKRLLSARPGSTVRAGKVRIKIPKTGASQSFIDRHAAGYTKRLINQRGLLIARTETLRSANEGQRELWRQGQESGTLPRDQKRIWIVTPDERLRDKHSNLSGQVVGIEESFNPPIEPGSEPNCRCAQGLI